jgi:WD40 repeat protein
LADSRLLAQWQGQPSPVWSLATSPTRREIAFAAGDGAIGIWRADLPAPPTYLTSSAGRVAAIRYCPAGQELVWVTAAGGVYLHDGNTSNPPKELHARNHLIRTAAIDPSCRLFALGDYPGTIELLDCRDAKRQGWSRKVPAGIVSLAFSPDGNLLASAGRDGAVRIWSIETGDETKRLNGHRAAVLSVCFSDDGRRLASGDGAGVVMVWDLQSGSRLAQSTVPKPHCAGALTFGLDGKAILIGGTGPELQLWRWA